MSSQCRNGGECISKEDGTFQCKCKLGTTGELCEIGMYTSTCWLVVSLDLTVVSMTVLNKFIHKGYKFDVVVRTLKLVFTDKNIDNLISNLHRY